ncbi:MAG: hypothetical protein ABSC11_10465 [Smithella sp.]
MEQIDKKTVRSRLGWSVEVPSIHQLKYSEGSKSLTLEIEGGMDESSVHWYIYSPSVWAWEGRPDNPFLNDEEVDLAKKRIREALAVLKMTIREFT